MNGLLFFGLSTAVMFAVLSQLIVIHLRAEIGNFSEMASKGAEASPSRNHSHAG
jgi:hypothetical protein